MAHNSKESPPIPHFFSLTPHQNTAVLETTSAPWAVYAHSANRSASAPHAGMPSGKSFIQAFYRVRLLYSFVKELIIIIIMINNNIISIGS
jgi:hypothetical protein